MRSVILSFSEIDRDPRVLRQISWLREEGYSVSFAGFGSPLGLGLESFHAVPVSSILLRYLSYLMPNRLRFWTLYGRHLSSGVMDELEKADVVVINELELIPGLLGKSLDKPIYLDLHENHIDDAHHGIFERIAFKHYWAWQTERLIDFVGQNRSRIRISTVEERISTRYMRTFNLPVDVIYNSPDTAQWRDERVSGKELRLVHLGMARKNRGIELILQAVSRLDRPFSLDLLLVFAPVVPIFRWKIERMIKSMGLSESVRLRPPVPVGKVVETLTNYDISLVIGSNATNNDLNSLPNKFFQSVQAGLMIICGPNPAVRALVERGGLGEVLDDWDAAMLVSALSKQSTETIGRFKDNTKRFAPTVSQAVGKERFREILADLRSRA